MLSVNMQFQSTLPRGERPNGFFHYQLTTNFNPRSHEGSDAIGFGVGVASFISIHAPTRGATQVPPEVKTAITISIHAPTRGATEYDDAKAKKILISIHAPTRGATSLKLDNGRVLSCISIHAPTRGATSTNEAYVQGYNDFNPRSHEGSDLHPSEAPAHKAISIHAPTRGATSYS